MWHFFQDGHLGPPNVPSDKGLATIYVWLIASAGLISLTMFVEHVWLDGTRTITHIMVISILLVGAVVFVRRWRQNQRYLRRAGIAGHRKIKK